MNGVFGQMRVGNMPLHAFNSELAAQAATAAIFYCIAYLRNRCGLAHNAVIKPLAALLQGTAYGYRAIKRGAFFVAGQNPANIERSIGVRCQIAAASNQHGR